MDWLLEGKQTNFSWHRYYAINHDTTLRERDDNGKESQWKPSILETKRFHRVDSMQDETSWHRYSLFTVGEGWVDGANLVAALRCFSLYLFARFDKKHLLQCILGKIKPTRHGLQRILTPFCYLMMRKPILHCPRVISSNNAQIIISNV